MIDIQIWKNKDTAIEIRIGYGYPTNGQIYFISICEVFYQDGMACGGSVLWSSDRPFGKFC